MVNTVNNSFELVRSAELPSLQANTSYFRHRRCGAEHFHLDLKGGDHAFMVAFRTLPADSTGVAHILEHTTLCGSRKFPVRDPFFLMLRRSLSTFMNAMTASDWTAYPFATKCEADFWNLMEVYLDATFFPLLRPLDFAQEGHRIEFKNPDNPDELDVRGVVYNEMKGAMSSPTSRLWDGLTRHLLKGTVYEHISGGDPEAITDLTHEALVAFHRKFYRPGNAIFMTAGELPVEQIQQRIEKLALAETQTDEAPAVVPAAARWQQGRSCSDAYPADADDRNHVLTAWLLPDARDPLARLKRELMSDLLLGTAASPLRRKLENSGIGRGLSPISGLEDSHRNAIFACGLKDVPAEDLPLAAPLIREGLEEICRNNIEPAQMQAAFQQLEFGCREITGDSMPFSLELLLDALPDLLYGDPPEPGLDPSPWLKQLEEQTAKADFLPEMIRSNLLNNPHTLEYQLRADSGMAATTEQQHAQAIRQLRKDMSEDDVQSLRDRQQQLADHQAKPDDPDILPKVGVEHLEANLELPEADRDGNLHLYSAPTNGISYLQLALPLPQMDLEDAALLPLYCACLTGLGAGGLDYAAAQTLRDRFLGGISVTPQISTHPSGEPMLWLSLTAKALDRHRKELIELPLQILNDWRLDEHQRIGEIRDQMLAGRENAISANGHRLAVRAAAAHFSPQAALGYHSGGLGGLQRLATAPQLTDPATLAERMQKLHQNLHAAPFRAALVTGPDQLDALKAQAEVAGIASAEVDWQPTRLQLEPTPARLGLTWQLPVNYCARSFPIPDRKHPDTPALSVLSALLRHCWLHPKVRERGGAYGAGAISDPTAGSFSLFSYRDPRLADTLADFDAGLAALPDLMDEQSLREAILAQASALQQGGSPAGEALSAFHRLLSGYSNDDLRQLRHALLEVSADDVLQVASKWLTDSKSSSAVLTGDDSERLAVLQKLGFERRQISL